MDERHSGRDHECSAPTRREHYQRCRPHQAVAAAVAIFAAIFGESADPDGPDANHPCIRQRRAVRTDADRWPGGIGNLPFPAQSFGNSNSQRSGAALTGGHIRRDVSAGL